MRRFRLLSVLLLVALGSIAVAQQPHNPEPAGTTAPSQNTGTGQGAGTVTAPGPGVLNSNDPILQPAPIPPGDASLIGGIVAKIDRVRQIVQVRPFGGGSVKIYFDDRTHIYRNSVETTMLGIKKGDRIYADTLLDGTRVFAKSLRVRDEQHPAEARGQLLALEPGRIRMRDELSSQQVVFRVGSDTIVRRGDQTASLADLRPGALVRVRFSPVSPGKDVAREINIIAAPGSVFQFAGKVTHLDMSRGLLALHNRTNDSNYEIHFDPRNSAFQELGVGSEVQLTALFNGTTYNARDITVMPMKASKEQTP
ncbi:MAG: hypothetical protein ACE14L_13465 [Terriglobales bacterium]